MTAKIGTLNVDLTLETARFDKAARKIDGKSSKMQTSFARIAKSTAAIGAGLGVALAGVDRVFGDLAKKAVDLNNSAQVAGEGFEEFQRQAFAASKVGIEFEKLGDIFKDVRDRIGDFITTGGGPMADFFENIAPKVGVTAEQFKKLGGKDALQLYYDSLVKAGVSSEEMVFYLEAMASDATALIPLLEKNGKAFAELGAQTNIIDQDQLDKLKRYEDAQKRIEGKTQDLTLALVDAGLLDAFADLKLSLVDGVVEFDKFYTSVQKSTYNFGRSIEAAVNAIPASINRMITQIGTAITGRLSAIWDGAIAKVERVRQTFWNLWDKVTRRSYVPDMVDDIQREMARLDGVLVTPAQRAAQKTEKAFSDLMDRLYPKFAAIRDMKGDLDLIDEREDKKEISREMATELSAAVRRQARTGTTDRQQYDIRPGMVDSKPLTDKFKEVGDGLKGLADRSQVQTVRIARTFEDMAQATLASLNRLSSAIKGGGFLGILEGVVGIGLQLGSTGLFGKTIANNLNRVEARAMGGPVTAGRPYLVGERGPELVVPRHSGRVISNDNLAMGGKLQIEVIANNGGFEAMVRDQAGRVVAASAPHLVQAASGAAMGAMYRQSKRSMTPGGAIG
ncbi:hypothetical protein [Qipengyuania spongiae]|uniref:Tail tape measure protein n=1 Tax=Qipengyuania spongiae TaxID=2909673 RepID=A0ABY5SXJ4_9SPHN|nr:hypothetical protein [Qipengyuania spongiae]UVI39248.1 hypothetical protein L1F33_13610 [Qipengyuania spongiae]